MTLNSLVVAWMEDPALAPLWPGRLGLTIAPGKKGVSAEGNRHDRDLSTDMTQLRADGVTRLVNLMEAHEETRWQMHGYDDAARLAGLRLRRFPVVDVSVPTDPAAFARMAEQIYAELQAGETVVAHCLGGLGRSGMLWWPACWRGRAALVPTRPPRSCGASAVPGPSRGVSRSSSGSTPPPLIGNPLFLQGATP